MTPKELELKEREVKALEQIARTGKSANSDYEMDSVLGCFPKRKRAPISGWERFWYGPTGKAGAASRRHY